MIDIDQIHFTKEQKTVKQKKIIQEMEAYKEKLKEENERLCEEIKSKDFQTLSEENVRLKAQLKSERKKYRNRIKEIHSTSIKERLKLYRAFNKTQIKVDEKKHEKDEDKYQALYYSLQRQMNEKTEKLSNLNKTLKSTNNVLLTTETALYLSYAEYGSLSTRKYLDLLSTKIYEAHQQNNKKCGTSQADLKIEGTSKRNVKMCLEHFMECPLNLETYDEMTKNNLFEVNYDWKTAAYNIGKLREIIITTDMPKCTQKAFQKIFDYLKEKYNEIPVINQLSIEFIELGSTMEKDQVKTFKVYKKACAGAI